MLSVCLNERSCHIVTIYGYWTLLAWIVLAFPEPDWRHWWSTCPSRPWCVECFGMVWSIMSNYIMLFWISPSLNALHWVTRHVGRQSFWRMSSRCLDLKDSVVDSDWISSGMYSEFIHVRQSCFCFHCIEAEIRQLVSVLIFTGHSKLIQALLDLSHPIDITIHN